MHVLFTDMYGSERPGLTKRHKAIQEALSENLLCRELTFHFCYVDTKSTVTNKYDQQMYACAGSTHRAGSK